MGHRVIWLSKRLGHDPGRIVDTWVFFAPLLRWTDGLSRLEPGASPAAANRGVEETEEKLSDLIGEMDRARVTASLVVLHEETDEFIRLAAQHPGRLFGLAYYDSLSPRRGLEQVQELYDHFPDLLLGVTTAMARFGQDPRLQDFVPLYEFCGEHGLPVQFWSGNDPIGQQAGRPVALAVLARSYPRLKLVCQYDASWSGEALTLLKRFENLSLQVDGRSLQPLLRGTTTRQLLFRGDWRGREPGYFERVEAVRRLPWWQRHNLGWRTAARVYGPRILCPSARSDPQPSSR